MLILGIESSCDDTGVALYDSARGLLGHALHSQINMHRAFGGVVPELASRDHIRHLVPLTRNILAQSGRSLQDIDYIAFTQGPGLGGALLTGASVAAGLGLALNRPLLAIHHLEGHLLSPLMDTERPDFPFVALLVSGGHTQLMLVEGLGDYKLLGETLDDAAGEAFDKAASVLGLDYPGGPALALMAAAGNAASFSLPRPMLRSRDLDFSFSGLKTALATLVNRFPPASVPKADIAACFQEAIVDVLAAKCAAALAATGAKTLVVAGGVGANRRLREVLHATLTKGGIALHFPPPSLCTDNGAMIAFAAAMHLSQRGDGLTAARSGFQVRPRWGLDAQRARASQSGALRR